MRASRHRERIDMNPKTKNALRVLAAERDAWMRRVLRNPAGPDLDAYLADRLHEDA